MTFRLGAYGMFWWHDDEKVTFTSLSADADAAQSGLVDGRKAAYLIVVWPWAPHFDIRTRKPAVLRPRGLSGSTCD